MAVNSRFIQVNPDALIEFIQDDQLFYEDEYSIIRDVKNNTTSFAFSASATDPDNYNKIPDQLYLIDSLINRYGVADPTTKSFLQESQFVNNQPSRFDKIKIWFPIHYVFPNATGFYLRLSTMDYSNQTSYNLANFFLDTSLPGSQSKIVNETKPFRLNQKLWGKSITLYVPSVYDESRLRTGNFPDPGTINTNLTSGVGLSQTSPVYFDFRFLSSKSIILGETTYITTPQLITNLSQAPEYNTLGVKIEHADDGDYFKINGLYNGSAGDFEVFMNTLEESGRRSYIMYSITVYEENIPQTPQEMYVYQDFLRGIETYRPVLRHTNTVASIRVDMKLINAVDGSVITKTAELTLTGNEVAKYGKYVTPINVTNAIKPKLYNSKPSQLTLPANDVLSAHLKRRPQKKTEIKFVPYPVLTDRNNIVAQEVTTLKNGSTFAGFGDLTIKLTPFDNVLRFAIYKQGSSSDVSPFEIPIANTTVNFIIKTTSKEVRVPLYINSNEVNLGGGVVVFKLTSADMTLINTLQAQTNVFYITLTTNGIETALYDGKFELLSNAPRKPITQVLSQINGRSLVKRPTFNKGVDDVRVTNIVSQFSLKQDVISQLKNVSLTTNQLKRLK